MSFRIDLFNFSKKENSTARPSNATSFQCTLKADSGIINPVIELDMGLNYAPSNFNYAYIPDFDRYYWIEEWTNEQPLWVASLHVDVLATYKGAIGDSDLYCLRASNRYDGNIIDVLYPTKTNVQTQVDSAANPWAVATGSGTGLAYIGGGTYVLCVTSSRLQGSVGTSQIVCISPSNMLRLVSNLVDAVNVGDVFGENADSVNFAKSILNPLQYIQFCKWIPVSYASISGSETANLTIFNWSTNIPFKFGMNDALRKTGEISFNLRKHPNTNARGNYLNASPFTRYSLFFEPFGTFELDGNILANGSVLECGWQLDYITGLAHLSVECNGDKLAFVTANVGVDIPLTQVTTDILGQVSNTINTLSNAMSGSVAGTIGGVMSSINSFVPHASSVGGIGGFTALNYAPKLTYEWYLPVNDDITRNGRPLCQVIKPKDLGGYMLIQDGDVSANASSYELDTIRNYLESGFYYE